jgi:hypothetical protein
MPNDPTPPTPPARPPDAIMVPKPFQRLADPHPKFNLMFLDVLGVRKIYTRAINHEQPQQYFITGTAECTRNFPTLHPLAGLARYDWFVVGETDTSPPRMPRPVARDTDAPRAVRYGWLRDPDPLVPPALDEKAEHARAYAGMFAEMLPKLQRIKELGAKAKEGALSDAEAGELHALAAEFAD